MALLPKTLEYFNPRSREGSDNMCKIVLYDVFNFNPRSREGSDFRYRCVIVALGMISIHAPAKGATTEKLERLT